MFKTQDLVSTAQGEKYEVGFGSLERLNPKLITPKVINGEDAKLGNKIVFKNFLDCIIMDNFRPGPVPSLSSSERTLG